MGFLHNTICYETLADATAAFWSATPPLITKKGVASVQFVAGQWQLIYPKMKGKAVVSALPQPSFPPCNPSQPMINGMYIGGILGLTIITVSLFAVMRRTV